MLRIVGWNYKKLNEISLALDLSTLELRVWHILSCGNLDKSILHQWCTIVKAVLAFGKQNQIVKQK